MHGNRNCLSLLSSVQSEDNIFDDEIQQREDITALKFSKLMMTSHDYNRFSIL